jgi:CRISPR-associated protein Csd1
VNHPLCDKLQYIAADFVEFGGTVTVGFAKNPNQPHEMYLDSLRQWSESVHSHWMVKAVLRYVEKRNVVRDLVDANLIPVSDAGEQLTDWDSAEAPPPIFRAIPKGRAPLDAVVRWRIEKTDELESATWLDQSLIDSWIQFDGSQVDPCDDSMCFVTGRSGRPSTNAPKKVRNARDQAKLISSTDTSGFTFRGRFLKASHAVGLTFAVVQKAHNALRWLIARQGYRNGDQVFVAWNPAGQPVPPSFESTTHLFLDDVDEHEGVEPEHDVGQAYARRLAKALAGYKAKFAPNDRVVALGLDSATPGRMSVTFYRELSGTDFIQRLETWHKNAAWYQWFGKDSKFIGAPSPKDVAEAAYGRRCDDKLKKATVARLVPCIIDGATVPFDIVTSLVNRTSNRVALERWEFLKLLGIACAMYRAYMHSTGKEHSMALETDNTSRDYLYGRLLALADHLEGRALFLAEEKRDTTAERHMHRFSARPFSTWQTIELALSPYKSRLRSRVPSSLNYLNQQIDDVMNLFSSGDFKSDKKLSGEFLLGFHCQRRALWSSKQTDPAQEDKE